MHRRYICKENTFLNREVFFCVMEKTCIIELWKESRRYEQEDHPDWSGLPI